MGNEEVSCGHICVKCGRQFIDAYSPPKGYSDEIKQDCLRSYVNGMGFRAIERDKGVHHTTIIYWLKQIGEQLPDAPPINEIPEVGELDELETFVGSKSEKLRAGVPPVEQTFQDKTKFGCGQQ
ncbi:hypothetical protein FDUTEX481_07168 [Tolypothrix sp. PCC 7601]|nr:hypothetical protein FDUTEX481_07168 [Tolypothrix sp. PCC 7601]BAY95528.1 IS1 transposase [Microchaete diplosiphon NIES-3275]